MSKKFISILLSLITAVSVFSLAASANEVEDEPAGVEVTVEKSGDSNTFKFDSGDWASNNICFYIWDTTDPDHTMYATKSGWVDTNPWGSKKLRGTKVEGEDGVFESYEVDIPDGHDVYVIFHDPDTNAQTYNCIINSNAYGQTAYMTGNSIENPVDSEKSALEATFDVDGCGPARVVTSSGNVVGDIIAPSTNRPLVVAQFVYQYIGQKEKLSGADIVTEDTVANAISAFETTADDVWAEFQGLNGKEGYEDYASKEADAKKVIKPTSASTDSDDDSDDDTSSNTSSKTTTSSTTSTKTTTTTTTSKSATTSGNGTADAAATGDTTGTVAFAVVLLVAAAAIVVTRKKVQD